MNKAGVENFNEKVKIPGTLILTKGGSIRSY